MPTLISGHASGWLPPIWDTFRQLLDVTNSLHGRFRAITDQDPSGSKSNRLRVGIFWFSFSNLRYVL